MNECIIECDSPEQLKALKDKATKVKLISLDRMGKHPLFNPTRLKDKERRKLIELMADIFKRPDEIIDAEFNEIVNDKLLDNEFDVSQYPVFDKDRIADTLDPDDIIYKLPDNTPKPPDNIPEVANISELQV
jgi:hypothetical protein